MRRIPVLDLVLGAVGLLLTGVEFTLLLRYGSWPYVVETLICLGLSAALVLRRRYLVGAAVATFLLLGAMAANVWLAPVGIGVSPLLACAPLSVIALTRYAPGRRWGLAAAAVAALGSPLSPAIHLAPRGWLSDDASRTAVLSMLAVHLLVVAVTYLWALRQREIAELHRRELDELARRNEALHAEAQVRETLAAARERNRIAREVHDIVAHSVALIQVEAATGLAIAETEPEHARHSLETIKKASRESLTEIRYLVGVLRDGPEQPAELCPAGSLAGLPAMLGRLRGSGVDLHDDLPDDEALRELDDGLDASGQLAVYRVVQEAVTNAVRHGGPGTSVRVGIVADDGWCRISVRNARTDGPARDGAPAQSGFGLLGLRERVDTVGGTVEHGPTADGFAVTAGIPLRAGVRP
ncbi:MAG: sensor histidine kinase [Pseudonocardia sp.]|nr:sensor histidine kinase [Pseudonocardia sp.]